MRSPRLSKIRCRLRACAVTWCESAIKPQGCAFICVADSAENSITVAPGANNSLQAAHLPSLDGFTHLLMQLEIPIETVAAYALAARARGVAVVLNAAPARALPAELLTHIDVLIVNEGELAAVSGHQGSIGQCLERVEVPRDRHARSARLLRSPARPHDPPGRFCGSSHRHDGCRRYVLRGAGRRVESGSATAASVAPRERGGCAGVHESGRAIEYSKLSGARLLPCEPPGDSIIRPWLRALFPPFSSHMAPGRASSWSGIHRTLGTG